MRFTNTTGYPTPCGDCSVVVEPMQEHRNCTFSPEGQRRERIATAIACRLAPVHLEAQYNGRFTSMPTTGMAIEAVALADALIAELDKP